MNGMLFVHSVVIIITAYCFIGCGDGPSGVDNALKESGSLVKECTAGTASSCSRVGVRIVYGTWGYKRDFAAALKYLERGCSGGDVSGCKELGLMYEHGRGVEKNIAVAAQLYEKACNGANGIACDYIAKMYRLGRGVAKDGGKAARYSGKACDYGIKSACGN